MTTLKYEDKMTTLKYEDKMTTLKYAKIKNEAKMTS